SVIWAAFMLAVVAYNYEDLSGTFGGLEGHPLLLVVTAYLIGPPLAIYLVGSILVWIGRRLSHNELRVFVPRSRRKSSVGPTRARALLVGRTYMEISGEQG